jgi:aminomethyltransferase
VIDGDGTVPPMALRTSPLDAVHRGLGAKLVEFGGWDMPVSYPTGTIAEHLACRRDAAVFDVSHLGTVRVTGANAFDALQSTLTSDLAKITVGRTQYHHLLDDADGSVLDDIIVLWVDDERFDVMPNASNTSRVLEAIPGVDVTGERAVLAVQGPGARGRLATVSAEAAAVARRDVRGVDVLGIPCVVSGTGYTGEDGVELAVPADGAPAVWDAIVAAGVVPAGLGARDTLRLEAGLPLHGHELGPGITPLQAGMSWVVAWRKDTFRGKAALEAERAKGVSRLLRGVVTEGRRPPREGSAVRTAGHDVGVVTSGNFSPVLETGIALAFVPPHLKPGVAVEVDVRGSAIAGWISETPFVGNDRPRRTPH